jgi:hypothetical protein
MKDEPQSPLHRLDHPSPTVIHHPEDDETILARWLRRGIEKGPRFWILLAGSIVAIVVLSVFLNGLLVGESESSKAWAELELARTPDEQEKVADAYRETVPGRWALLQAAGALYNEAFNDLPTGRDKAEPLLKRAYNLYADVYKEADKVDPVQARLAAMGMARSLEASNDLPRAIEQYRLVAKTWPDSEEGKRADRRARELERPENAEFYKWLADYKPPEMTLPPGGKGIFDLPTGHPPLGDLPILPPSPTPADSESGARSTGPGTGTAPATDLPPDVFESPSPAPAAGGVKPGDVPAPGPAAADGAAKP